MELLNLLETRINALLTHIDSLKAENNALKEEMQQGQSVMLEENRGLKQALEQEERIREASTARLDALLKRLDDYNDI